MSLMKFLAAGRSLKAVNAHLDRYQMSEQGWLPRFEAKPMIERTLPQTATAAPSDVWPQTSGPLQPRSEPSGRRSVFGSIRHVFHRNPFEPRKPTETVLPPRPSPLNLDNLRVVRNDLFESGAEVTPSETESPPEAPQTTDALPAKGYLKSRWVRWAGRIRDAARSL